MKTCSKCHKNKEDSEFYFMKNKGKLQAECRACTKLRKSRYLLIHREHHNSVVRAQKQTPRGRYLRLKEDSNKRNIVLNITETVYKQLIQRECFYCCNLLGLKTIYGVGLDRLDNTIGYEIHNVVPCCSFCNTIKGYLLTPEEMKDIAELLIEKRKNSSPIDAAKIKIALTKSRKDPII